MFILDKKQASTIPNLELGRLALNNKAYGLRLALKNSGKVAAAAYLTGLAWQIFGNSNKK